MRCSTSSAIVALCLVLGAASFSQAMLPPPMLRAACAAFADAEEVVGNKALAAGKLAVDMAMKPIAIVGGLKAAAVGTGMKVGGGAIKFVGAKMAKDGAILEAAGAGVKGAGLGVAALGLKPIAEKVIVAGKAAEGTVNAANSLMNKVGDTSIELGATIDSPLLGHHHKEISMTAGLDAKQGHGNEIQQQQVTELDSVKETVKETSQQSSTVSKRAAPKIDPDLMKSVMNLMRDAKMEDCVARAVCDLNCNPQGFGQDGKQVFLNMVRLQGSNLFDEGEAKYFREAASKGRSYSGKCDQCSSHYSQCNSKSSDLIKMASHIKLD